MSLGQLSSLDCSVLGQRLRQFAGSSQYNMASTFEQCVSKKLQSILEQRQNQKMGYNVVKQEVIKGGK